MENYTLKEIYNDAEKIKEMVFKWQDKLYPATNKDIAKYKETMSLFRMSSQIRGRLEKFLSCVGSLINEYDDYIIIFCEKCNDWTFHNKKKTTGNCIVCHKRNKIENR